MCNIRSEISYKKCAESLSEWFLSRNVLATAAKDPSDDVAPRSDGVYSVTLWVGDSAKTISNVPLSGECEYVRFSVV